MPVLTQIGPAVSMAAYMPFSVPGSRSSSASVLAELQKLLEAEAELKEKERQLADISQQIQKIEKTAAR